MKYDCGLSEYTKRQNRQKWHRWFAWYPVRVEDNDCRWFEYVERKYIYLHSLSKEDMRQYLMNISYLCGFIYRVANPKNPKEGNEMDRELLIKRLKGFNGDDPEVDHIRADNLLLEFINDKEISDAFISIMRWYS